MVQGQIRLKVSYILVWADTNSLNRIDPNHYEKNKKVDDELLKHTLELIQQILEMNPASYIINTSRGQILNEHDVVSCLISGQLAGVAVDVLDQEYNIQSSPLWNYIQNTNPKNVLITPHIGGCTYESMEATESFIAEKFVNILKEQQ